MYVLKLDFFLFSIIFRSKPFQIDINNIFSESAHQAHQNYYIFIFLPNFTYLRKITILLIYLNLKIISFNYKCKGYLYLNDMIQYFSN